MFLLTAVLPAAACTPNIFLAVSWPPEGAVVSPDTVVVIHRVQNEGPAVLLDDLGAEVPLTVYPLPGGYDGDTFEVFVPTQALEPGAYTVGLGGYGDHSFTVADGEAAPTAPPVPVWRTLATDLQYTEVCGSGDRVDVDRVMYRLCGDAVLYLVLDGGAPTAAHVSEAQPWAWETDTFDLGAVVEGPVTLWFAAMDGAGRISAWTGPDVVEMPGPRQLETFTMPGAEGGGTTTPTTFSTCPPYGEWESEGLQQCGDGADCEPVGSGWGCASGGADPAGWLALGCLMATRRRRSG